MESYVTENQRLYGVIGYEIAEDFIVIQFYGGRICRYTYKSAGKKNVDRMKKLAIAQNGLTSYIGHHKPKYESKL